MTFIVSTLSFISFVATTGLPGAKASGPVSYSYDRSASNGPQNWQNLEMDGNECGGTYNSPIDIKPSNQCDLKEDYVFTEGDCPLSSMNFFLNDHGVQANFPEDGSCKANTVQIPKVDGNYEAIQYHIHSSTEHTVDSKHFDFEMHIVHKLMEGSGDGSGPNDRTNEYAVVGIMLKQGGEKNAKFQTILDYWTHVYEGILNSTVCTSLERGDTNTTSVEVFAEENNDHSLRRRLEGSSSAGSFNIYSLMTTLDFYFYSGGLTTPPCSEVVWWNLNADPISISDDQAALLLELITGYRDTECHEATVADPVTLSTSRPTQAVSGRPVELYCPGEEISYGQSDGSFFFYNAFVGAFSLGLMLAIVL